MAYSRWPSKEARDNSWPGENATSDELPVEIRNAVMTIKDCLDPDRKFRISAWKWLTIFFLCLKINELILKYPLKIVYLPIKDTTTEPTGNTEGYINFPKM